MSISAYLYLPWGVTLLDFSKVLVIASGIPATLNSYGDLSWDKEDIPYSYRVFTHHPSLVDIILEPKNGRLRDGEAYHIAGFSFESEGTASRKGPYVSVKSTQFWLETLAMVARFFGGTLYPNDCSEVKPKVFRTPKKIRSLRGRNWRAYHAEMLKLKPTKEITKWAKKTAGY